MNILKILNPVGALVSYINLTIDRLRLKKLIKRGLKIGKNVVILENVDFDRGYPFLISIGDNCRISKEVRILSHDATTFRDAGINKIAPVKILEDTYIGERVTILSGVTIGPRAMVAAGSVVTRDVAEGKCVAGNPARPYANFSDLMEKNIEKARTVTVFNKEDIENGLISTEDMIRAVEQDGVAYTRGTPKKDPFYLNADFDEVSKQADKVYKEHFQENK